MMARTPKRLHGLDLPEGFELERARNGHYRILDRDGEPLRSQSGRPLHAPFSPSDHRSIKNLRALLDRTLREAGGEP